MHIKLNSFLHFSKMYRKGLLKWVSYYIFTSDLKSELQFMRVLNFWEYMKLFQQSTFNSTYMKVWSCICNKIWEKGECHPTFCCWIIAQNRTWYARDKRQSGPTWQVIWTNVSSISRTGGSWSPNDANLLLAHSLDPDASQTTTL